MILTGLFIQRRKKTPRKVKVRKKNLAITERTRETTKSRRTMKRTKEVLRPMMRKVTGIVVLQVSEKRMRGGKCLK